MNSRKITILLMAFFGVMLGAVLFRASRSASLRGAVPQQKNAPVQAELSPDLVGSSETNDLSVRERTLGSTWTIELFVISELQEPIARAAVRVLDAHGRSISADLDCKTNAAGVAIMRLPDHVAYFEAQAAGFKTKRVEVDSTQRNMQIRLERSHSIRGRVVHARGDALPTPVTVIAWPQRLGKSAPGLLTASESIIVTTDVDGAFILPGIAGSRRWALAAGGSGVMTKEPHLVSLSVDLENTESLELEVVSVGGGVIRFEGPEGQPQCIPPMQGAAWGGFTCVTSNSYFLSTDSAEAVLAGLPQEFTWSVGSTFALLLEIDTRQAEPPTFWCKARFAGYEEQQIPLRLRFLAEGIAQTRTTLVQLAEFCSVLSVDVQGQIPEGLATLRQSLPMACIILVPESGGLPLEADLAGTRDGHLLFHCVPFGKYQVFLKTAWSKHLILEPTLDVTTQQQTVGVRLGAFGAARFTVSHATESYDGPLCISMQSTNLRSRHAGSGRPVFFSSPPYQIEFLEPGEYTFRAIITNPQANHDSVNGNGLPVDATVPIETVTDVALVVE